MLLLMGVHAECRGDALQRSSDASLKERPSMSIEARRASCLFCGMADEVGIHTVKDHRGLAV